MSRLINIAIHRPIAVLMLTLALALFGWRALGNMETALLPDIEYPEFFIITEFAGGAPEEIEQQITIPIEEVLSSLPGIQDIVSHSREGLSVVEAQFHWDIDFQFTLLRIREKIDAVRGGFPEGTQRPFIMDFNPNSAPVMELVVSGSENSLTGLTAFVEDVLQPRFSQLDGIASARMTGAPQQAIQIQLQPDRLVQYGVPVARVVQAVRDNIPEQTLSARVMVGYAEYPLTVRVQVHSLEDFLQMPVVQTDSSFVPLEYLAAVTREPLPQRSRTYWNSDRVIGLQLYRESGANTIQATDNAVQLLELLQQEYPEVRIQVITNRGTFVRQAIAGLLQALQLGALLAFLMLLLYLRHLRLSLILALTIPVSILVTFIAFYVQGISLNIMSLGGLALGIGLIVDNGIYVTESIARQMDDPADQAPALTGTTRVARAIVGATFTTIAIFLPIIYVRGYASVLFEHQALAITYTLLVSLFAALTLIPTAVHALVIRARDGQSPVDHSSDSFFQESKIQRTLSRFWWRSIRRVLHGLRTASQSMAGLFRRIFAPIGRWFDRGYNGLEVHYHRVLDRALDHKGITLLAGLGILMVAVGLFSILPKQYWPPVGSRYVEMDVAVPVSMPYSALLEQTERSAGNLQAAEPVRSVLTRIMDPTAPEAGSYQQALQQAGFYSVRFLLVMEKPVNRLEPLRAELTNQLQLPREHLTLRIAGNLQQEFSAGAQKNFLVYSSGERHDQVLDAADSLRAYLSTLDEVQNISVEFGGGETVLAVHPRPFAMSRHRLTPAQVSSLLSQQARGEVAGHWQQGNRKIPVTLIWDKPESKHLTDLLDFPAAHSRQSVPMDALISVAPEEQRQEITRVNRSRVVAVQADVPPHRLMGIVDQVQQHLRDQPVPGVEMRVAGESQRVASSFQELQGAFLLAVIIVYLILAAQFESLVHPLNILLTVPMGIVGAVFGLTLFQQSLNVISLIGMIMLIGIGVNDAIIKVDYMNYLQQQGRSLREAVLRTSREKFRPVMMTSTTTIAAMLPLLLGLGGNTAFNRPLAATIIGGLLFTTALTLIFTPVLYEVFDRITSRWR